MGPPALPIDVGGGFDPRDGQDASRGLNLALLGMTWDHPRGFDPLVACSALWTEISGVEITWDKRSLQDFESFPVEELAARYDLIIIDHPHVGQVTARECLLALDVAGREEEGAALAQASVGRSYPSYRWLGRQWAIPIDAASQVQAWRPDLLAAPPQTFDEVLLLAREGQVLCPLRPPHSLLSLCSILANIGAPCDVSKSGDFIELNGGLEALQLLRALTNHLDPACFSMDPIAAFEQMARRGSQTSCIPLAYGYVSYAKVGFRDMPLAFCDMPQAGDLGPLGSALGGTGIAVSARTLHPDDAIAFAYWVTSAEVQRGPYAMAGGQPGHAEAWEDPALNQAAGNSFSATRATLEGAWVRPRHDGYMAFQDSAARRVNSALMRSERGERLIEDLNRMFRDSFGGGQ